MHIQKNLPLAPLTTLGVGGAARFYVTIDQGHEAVQAFELAKKENLPLFVFSGGSNLVVADRGLEAVVLHPHIQGIEVAAADENTVTLRIGAGEVWDDVVAYAVAQGLWGVENLSAIPGYAGAAPVQNIGAYGQEVKNTLTAVEALNMQTGQLVTFTAADCAFGYRKSRFNTDDKGKYLILYIHLALQRQGQPHLGYKDLQTHFAGQPTPSLAEMRQAVISIRASKLHNPAEQGNVGSFFKNPTITHDGFNHLVQQLNPLLTPQMQARLAGFAETFNTPEGIKVPGGFLIEACGLVEQRCGGMAVSHKHALVLVNKTGTATANDVLQLAAHVVQTVRRQTGVALQPEPQFVGFTPEEMRLLAG